MFCIDPAFIDERLRVFNESRLLRKYFGSEDVGGSQSEGSHGIGLSLGAFPPPLLAARSVLECLLNKLEGVPLLARKYD